MDVVTDTAVDSVAATWLWKDRRNDPYYAEDGNCAKLKIYIASYY